MRRRILLFSDVDGTLLDRSDRLAIGADEFAHVCESIELILTPSRTLPELCALQDRLSFRAPMIAENGAPIAVDAGECGFGEGGMEGGFFHRVLGRRLRVLPLAGSALHVRSRVWRVALALDVAYDEQRDVLTRSAVAHTRGSRQALQRTHSVLIRLRAGARECAFAALADTLRLDGLSVSSGGGWTAVVAGSDKGAAAVWLAEALQRARHCTQPVAAVGDGENDEALLSVAERAFVVRNDDGTWHDALTAIPGAVRLDPPDIAGWLPAIDLLARERAATC